MTIQKLQHIPPPTTFNSISDVAVYLRKMFDALFKVMQGKIQCVAEVTLTPSATTTTITDARISIQTALLFDPRTLNAATELAAGTMYVLDANRAKGSCTITHANNLQADRTFYLALIG